MKAIAIVLVIVYFIAVEVLYHKTFTVFYFSLGDGLLKEVFICLMIAVMLPGLTLKFWWILVAFVGIAVIIGAIKNK